MRNGARSTAAVANTAPSDATRLTELFFGPPTIARKLERKGIGDGCAVATGDGDGDGDGDGVTVAARGTTVPHAVNKTTNNSNRPINIQNEAQFAPLR
jgi:hypothetical protein